MEKEIAQHPSGMCWEHPCGTRRPLMSLQGRTLSEAGFVASRSNTWAISHQHVGSLVALMVPPPPDTYMTGNKSQGCLLRRATQGRTDPCLSSDQVFGVRWACVDIFKLQDSVTLKEPNSWTFLPVFWRHTSVCRFEWGVMFPWSSAWAPLWLCQRWGFVGGHSSLWQTSAPWHVWLWQPPKVKIILIKS